MIFIQNLKLFKIFLRQISKQTCLYRTCDWCRGQERYSSDIVFWNIFCSLYWWRIKSHPKADFRSYHC